MEESPLAVLRREFEGHDGTFMMKIRPELEWDKEAFHRMVTAMQAYCEEQAGRWQVPPGDDTTPRWIAFLIWFIPRFVKDWTTHPNFPRPYSEAYYEAAYERLDNLAWWFFTGESPHEDGKGFGSL